MQAAWKSCYFYALIITLSRWKIPAHQCNNRAIFFRIARVHAEKTKRRREHTLNLLRYEDCFHAFDDFAKLAFLDAGIVDDERDTVAARFSVAVIGVER